MSLYWCLRELGCLFQSCHCCDERPRQHSTLCSLKSTNCLGAVLQVLKNTLTAQRCPRPLLTEMFRSADATLSIHLAKHFSLKHVRYARLKHCLPRCHFSRMLFIRSYSLLLLLLLLFIYLFYILTEQFTLPVQSSQSRTTEF